MKTATPKGICTLAFVYAALGVPAHAQTRNTTIIGQVQEIKRRTLVVRIFPNPAACLRLIRALAVETHENWIETMQYLNMEPLNEQKKEALRKLGDAA
jgi:putative transposase